jgi:hypothetical protein
MAESTVSLNMRQREYVLEKGWPRLLIEFDGNEREKILPPVLFTRDN